MMTIDAAISAGIARPPVHYFLSEPDPLHVAEVLRTAWAAVPFAHSAQGLTPQRGANDCPILFVCTPYRHGVRVQFRYSLSL